MTITEALKASRENGKTYSRTGGKGFPGWISWHDTHLYHSLSADDLTSDDWELSHVMIEKLTERKWTTSDDPVQ